MYDDAKYQYFQLQNHYIETVYFQGDYKQAIKHIMKSENMFLNAKKKQEPTKISDNTQYPSKLTEIEHQLT